MRAELSTSAIWSQRAHSFRTEIIPYIRYMGQSGFPAFLSLIFIAGSIGYFTLIRDLPPDFPIAAVGTVALTLAICWSPLRTWLVPADVVFLMPREAEMEPYMRMSFRNTTIGCVLLAAVVLLLYLPIYNQGQAYISGMLIIIAAAVLKAGNVLGAWQERKMAWPGMRLLLRLLRWVLTGAVWYVWLTCLLWQAAAFTLLAALLLALAYRLPLKHQFPWERLIDEEERTRKRYYLFFGMFVDVPTQSSKVARRSYLNGLLRIVPYANRNTFVFLYTASLLRTEIGGMVIRIMLLGGLVSYWIADAAFWSGWAAVAVYGLFMFVIAVQLGSLRHVHRYSVWQHVYPLPHSQRIGQYVRVDLAALIACAVIIWLCIAIPLISSGMVAPAVTALAGVLLYATIRPGRLKRKMAAEADEEED